MPTKPKKPGRPAMNEGRIKLTTMISPATEKLLSQLRQRDGRAIGRIIDEAISAYGKK